MHILQERLFGSSATRREVQRNLNKTSIRQHLTRSRCAFASSVSQLSAVRQFLLFTRLLLAAGICLLGACKDDPTTGPTQVEGVVVQRQSRQPVGNGTVQVWLAGTGGEDI